MANGTIKNTNKRIAYYSLVTQSLSSAGTNTLDVINGRKISDYDMIFVNVGYDSRSRGTFIIPRNLFAAGQALYVTYTYSGTIKTVTVSYVSDTQISVSNSDALSTTEYVYVYGLKIV